MKDGYKWWCKACKTSKTIRTGSFFKKSKIPLRTWILLIHLWAYQLPVCTVAQLVEVNKETAINVSVTEGGVQHKAGKHQHHSRLKWCSSPDR